MWAIGDIHGRLDLLKPLVEAIRTDAAASQPCLTRVIFLGDYIDRGADSRGVIQHLASLPKDQEIEWHFLKGNHEEAMLDFLEDPTQGEKWCEYGGDATLASYGLRVPHLKHKPEAWVHLCGDLNHRVTPFERRFLGQLELSLMFGDYFFSHAGARPGEALENQDPVDLLWIRRSFLDSPDHFDKVVVHGHTPTAEVHVDQRRIGIDTKAYESGRLSAVRFEGGNRQIVASCVGDHSRGSGSTTVVGLRSLV